MKRGNRSNLQVNAELLKDRKVRQRWLLASAVALSMLGAGTVVNMENASAATVGNNSTTTAISQSSKVTSATALAAVSTSKAANKESAKNTEADTDVAAPVVYQPYAGDRTITGTGTPGNTIIVRDDLKNEIGRSVVDQDGNYSVEIKAEYELFVGETISVVQVDANGNESSPVNMKIAERVPAPILEQPYEGDRTVTGRGVPGYTVNIYDDLKNKIGSGKVDAYGTFRANIWFGYNLYQGETITAVQQDLQGNESSPVKIKVKTKEDTVPKPYVNQPYVGDRTIEGIGEVGCTVEITNGHGDYFGSDIVDGNNRFSVTIPAEYELYEGEQIKAVQINANGDKSEETTITVLTR
ncbi:Ig-like domain-containing protein [Pediococcus acidilactici]|uniref:Ig-like domain-containing protein n=1 Tax=Pediococcus acidilactici TaxID=1254 RepID=UPI003CFA9E10